MLDQERIILLPKGVDVRERGLDLGDPPIPRFENARDRFKVGPAVGGTEEVHELLTGEGGELNVARVGIVARGHDVAGGFVPLVGWVTAGWLLARG